MGSLEGIDLYRTMSILGYGLRPQWTGGFGYICRCVHVISTDLSIRLIPIVFLAIFGIIVSLKWEAELIQLVLQLELVKSRGVGPVT